jgi:hypothetical protein
MPGEDARLIFPARQMLAAIIEQRGASSHFMTALDFQKINSGIYFAAAGLLICLAAMLVGRKVQRNLNGKWIASVLAVSIVTFGLIWYYSPP